MKGRRFQVSRDAAGASAALQFCPVALALLCTLPPSAAHAQGSAARPSAKPAAVEVKASATSRAALFDLEGEGATRPGAKETPIPLPSKADLFDLKPGSGPTAESAAGALPGVPADRDALFGLTPAAGQAQRPEAGPAAGDTRAALFATPHESGSAAPASAKTGLQGFFVAELAYNHARPSHWSKLIGRLQLGGQGQTGAGVRWKASARLDFNPVYDLTDFYQSQVGRDQRLEFTLRETYLDFTTGNWEWRLGRQHIVWGEMVGLFFADVVSAKDMREFVMPDFQILRIPQWAVRAEYYGEDFHAELVWIPLPGYDRIGKPKDFGRAGSGADFYPYPVAPPGATGYVILNEDLPSMHLKHGNAGIRLSRLRHGWDVAGFLYSSMDAMASFRRQSSGSVYVFQPRHDRIWQAGATLAKDLGEFVLKAEAVYTHGRRYNVRRAADADGLAKQNTLDWVLGLDFNPWTDTRLNTQLFQRVFLNHDADVVPERWESGFSLLLNHKLSRDREAEVLLIHSLNRSDWLLRPRFTWVLPGDWRWSAGLDVFSGPREGFFGRYDPLDRIWTELRYDF